MKLRKIFKKKKLYLYSKNNTYLRRDTYISKKEHIELRNYAQSKNVRISNFKKFSGDIDIIKELIDDIHQVAQDFPLIFTGRKRIELAMDYFCNENVFATTEHHIIYLNANLFSDINYLETEYNIIMSQGKFVANTNYRAVVRHEIGHVVANIYGIDSMEIAKQILNTKSSAAVIEYVKENLSLYAGDYSDGREIISESFSGYYSNAGNDFAEKFVELCIKLKGGDINEEE